jgi:integrase
MHTRTNAATTDNMPTGTEPVKTGTNSKHGRARRQEKPVKGLRIRPRKVRYARADGTKVVKTYWTLDQGEKGGKRVVRTFPTREEAEAEADALRKEIVEYGLQAHALTPAQRAESVRAYHALAKSFGFTPQELPHGAASIAKAVEFYLSHHAPEGGRKTVKEVVAEHIARKEASNRREKTISDLQSRLGQFERDFGNRMVSSVTTTDIERWMDAKGFVGLNRLHFRSKLVGLLNFAMRRRYVSFNAAADVERPEIDEKPVEIHTVPEVVKVMQAAAKHAPRMVPYFALGYFSGLRPNELKRMDWADIDLQHRIIRVGGAVAKKRRQRLVDISDNLLAWLAPHRNEKGLVYYSRNDFELVRRRAKTRWPYDVMRHCFGSYYYALTKSVEKAADQMGHLSVDMLVRHYKALVTNEDTAKFWNVMPKQDGNIIALDATAAG